jgi:hypothetical protein
MCLSRMYNVQTVCGVCGRLWFRLDGELW